MKQRERTNLVFFLSSFTSFLQLLALLWKSGTVLFFSFVIYVPCVPCVLFVTFFSFETDAKGTCLSSFQLLPISSPPVLLNSCFSSIRISSSIRVFFLNSCFFLNSFIFLVFALFCDISSLGLPSQRLASLL